VGAHAGSGGNVEEEKTEGERVSKASKQASKERKPDSVQNEPPTLLFLCSLGFKNAPSDSRLAYQPLQVHTSDSFGPL
jgi:hypothetical protein